MPLQNLPVEILCTILCFVGSDQLRKQEACCLLVCRWWYKLAEPILLGDLVLSANQITQLPEPVHGKLRALLRQLTIDVHGALDWPAGDGNERLSETLNSLLLRCSRLTSFTLRVRSQFDPTQPLAPRNHYLSTWSPARFLETLSLSKLSEFVVDTCGSEFNTKVHICPQLALIIPSLRSVRLRMHSICPQILDLQDRGCSKPSRIESIIINLSLKETNRFSAGFSRHCTKSRRAWELCDDMVVTATNIAKHALSLKVLRILCHKHPSLEMVAKDCIAGTTMIISDKGDWDWADDGWTDPDDEEISDEDFSSTGSNSGIDNLTTGGENGKL